MDHIPVDVRKLILNELECGDYLNALESSKYWYVAKDETTYDVRKSEHLKLLKERRVEETYQDVRNTMERIFKTPVENEEENEISKMLGPVIGNIPGGRESMLSILDNGMFQGIMKQLFALGEDEKLDGESVTSIVEKIDTAKLFEDINKKE